MRNLVFEIDDLIDKKKWGKAEEILLQVANLRKKLEYSDICFLDFDNLKKEGVTIENGKGRIIDIFYSFSGVFHSSIEEICSKNKY